MAATNYNHTPILLNEVAALILLKPGGIYVDGTLGGGGHSAKLLEGIAPTGRLIGIDRDPAAIREASNKLEDYGDAFTGVHGNYKDMDEMLDELGIELVDGILLDLGVSSHQLDTPSRGFSYNHDAPLDMRMNPNDHLSAYDVVNKYDKGKLIRVIKGYGEERFAARIADRIIKSRQTGPIETTGQLVEIIKEGIPAPARRKGPHPAKRTFQAIRIEVNGELHELDQAIENMVKRLKKDGRLCVITFHSLEDRVVKQTMRRLEAPCVCPSDAPVCVCNRVSMGVCQPRKPVLPTPQEIEINPRARSAKLRVFVKS